jgi:hypothetical protein
VLIGTGLAAEIEVGSATGQNDHSLLPSSQYKSIVNRRNPAANRFEKQSAKFASSNMLKGKQVAKSETPGNDMKFTGTASPKSL